MDEVDLNIPEWKQKKYTLSNKLKDLHTNWLLYYYKTQSAPDKITLDELNMAARDCIYWLIMCHYLENYSDLPWGKLDTNLIGYVKYTSDGEINIYQTKKQWRTEVLSIMRQIHLKLDNYYEMRKLMEKNTDWVYALLKMIYPEISFNFKVVL